MSNQQQTTNSKKQALDILFEDNHLIIVNKKSSDIVQGDKTGDIPLSEKIKSYIKQKYNKPGDVFLGVTHRIDRPTSGIVLFAKTSKSLTRINQMFKDKDIKKTYLAITNNKPHENTGTLTNFLLKNEKQNKSFVYKDEKNGAKKAILHYKLINKSDNYFLLEVEIETGRHHQIRCQLANIGCHIKGDLKYGAKRSNPDGSISLHAWKIQLIHPVKKEFIEIIAPTPNETIWNTIITNN